jgi:hypothetical protein
VNLVDRHALIVLRAMGTWAIQHPTNPAPIFRW